MGKVPIAGLEQGLSMMNLIVIRFWSRVAQFFCSKKNVSVSKIDKMIGFSPGPFQMMDQVSRLSYVFNYCTVLLLDWATICPWFSRAS